METLQHILVTGPELGASNYEAIFLPELFEEFKNKAGKVIEAKVSQKEIDYLRNCDLKNFGVELKKYINRILGIM